MPIPFSSFARPFLVDRQSRATLAHPVVLMMREPVADPAAPRETPDDGPTSPGAGAARPTLTEPVVFEVKKANKPTNAFALGITIGRTDNNDIVLTHDSVSRFHGYFQRDAASDLWTVVDMGSKNGITAGAGRLVSNKPHVCAAREELVIGRVELLFLVPETFFAFLEEQLGSAPPATLGAWK